MSDIDKAIRAAKLTLGGILEKNRAKQAQERAPGQIAPSKYMPNVPRAVHADGGRVDDGIAAAETVAGMLRDGREKEITNDHLNSADPQHLWKLYETGQTGMDLPMDSASRMERAKAMGMTNKGYHSTLKDTDSFDPAGKFMGYTGTSGISTTDNPKAASRYLDRYGERDYKGVPFEKNIVPTVSNIGRTDVRDAPYKSNVAMGAPLPKGYTPEHVRRGFDSAQFPDAVSAKGSVRHSDAKNAIRSTETVMSDPAKIRSQFARFDPRLAHLSHLSAATGGRAVHAAGGYVPAPMMQNTPRLAVARAPIQAQQPEADVLASMQSLTDTAKFFKGGDEAPAPEPHAAHAEPHGYGEGISAAAAKAMSGLQSAWAGPEFGIVSGYRDPKKNEEVGGASGSQHIHGNAFDVDTTGWSPDDKLALADAAWNAGFRGFGFYDNNMHFDVGAERGWGPSHSRDSIPDWAQGWTANRYGYAEGGGIGDRATNLAAWHQDADDAVKNSDGTPKTFYHRTSGDFSTFKADKDGPSGPAMFFGDDPSNLPQMHNRKKVGDNIMPVHLHMKSPLFLDEFNLREMRERHAGGSKDFPHLITPQVAESLQAKGFDGIVAENIYGKAEDANEYVTFQPHQIKSAIGNQGAFDPGNPDITKAEGGGIGDNDNFANWFGNSVTHTDGEPHVFYTGTSKDKDFTSHNVGRHGAWFTRDPEVASSYAAQNDSQGYKREGWNMVSTNTASRVIPAYVKAENPYTGPLPPETLRDNYKAAQSDWFDTLRAKGHDAWIPADQGGNLVVALKEPQQIKSIYNNGKFDPNQKHMNKADGGAVERSKGGRTVTDHGLYSKAAEIIRGLPQEKGTVDQYIAAAKKLGAKPSEIEHAGRPDGDKISREDMAKHFDQNLPKMEVHQYGENPSYLSKEQEKRIYALWGKPKSEAEQAEYDLLMRRTKGPQVKYENAEYNDENEPRPTEYEGYTIPGGSNYRERLLTLPATGNNDYVSSHWHENDNILAHIRMSDRTVGGDRNEMRPVMQKLADHMGVGIRDLGAGSAELGVNRGVISPEEAASISRLMRWSGSPYYNKPGLDKRVLHVEEMQSDWGQEGKKHGFYDPKNQYEIFDTKTGEVFSKHPSNVEMLDAYDKIPEDQAGSLSYGRARYNGKKPAAPYVQNTQHWTDLALKNVLHEAAMGNYDHVVFTPGQAQADRYNLKDSGEGMKGYYDNILPKSVMRLAQQHDPDIKPGSMPLSDQYTGFSIPMTDKLKQGVLGGQTAFKRGGTVEKSIGGSTDGQQDTAGTSQARPEAGGLPVAGGVRGSSGVLPSQGETPLEGLPQNVRIPLTGGSLQAGPDPRIREIARQYMASSGLPYNPPTKYAKVDPGRSKRIASAYEAMTDNPDDPLTKASYSALAKETMAQYQAAKAAGFKAEFWHPSKQEDPYKASPRLAVEDVRNNHHMWVYPTYAGYGSGEITDEDVKKNPMLQGTGEHWNGIPVTVNDVFRAIHDYYGHAKEGVGFRADGEENAWRAHASMFSPLARMAMTSETRGQNSWLNYGPHGEANRGARTEDTIFAPQKVGIMPDWVHHEGAEDFVTPEDVAELKRVRAKHSFDFEKALGITRSFTKDGKAATMKLKLKE
jgi:hypothetical protein